LLSNCKDKEQQSDTEIIYQCAGLIWLAYWNFLFS